MKQEGSVLKKYVSKSAHILFFLSFARVSRSSPRTPRHFHRLWSFPAEEHGAKSGVRRLKKRLCEELVLFCSCDFSQTHCCYLRASFEHCFFPYTLRLKFIDSGVSPVEEHGAKSGVRKAEIEAL